jgi:hypothetical protein
LALSKLLCRLVSKTKVMGLALLFGYD